MVDEELEGELYEEAVLDALAEYEASEEYLEEDFPYEYEYDDYGFEYDDPDPYSGTYSEE